jgi:hypothetical protein
MTVVEPLANVRGALKQSTYIMSEVQSKTPFQIVTGPIAAIPGPEAVATNFSEPFIIDIVPTDTPSFPAGYPDPIPAVVPPAVIFPFKIDRLWTFALPPFDA